MKALIPIRSLERELEPYPFRSFRTEMGRLFEDFFGGNGGSETMTWPATEVVETKDNLIVRAEIPGIDPKDLNISVTEDMLTISGEKKQEMVKEEANRYLAERSYGEFRRSFRLPSWADADKIEASFKNGVVELTIGKRAEAKPRAVKVKMA